MNLEYIKVPDCKHGYLYRLHSRNLSYGIYRKDVNGFIGIREKFGHLYLFTEYHWDNESFATAKPLEEIEEVPKNLVLNESLGTECGTCHHPIDYFQPPGKWIHTDGAECDEPYGQSIHNKKLFNYLTDKEESFGIKRAVKKLNEEI